MWHVKFCFRNKFWFLKVTKSVFGRWQRQKNITEYSNLIQVGRKFERHLYVARQPWKVLPRNLVYLFPEGNFREGR